MRNALFGLVCLDVYADSGMIRPGCGILHNAYHLQQLGCDAPLVTRIGVPHSEVFLDFLRRNQIPTLPNHLIAEGESATITIHYQPSGDTKFSNYRQGVWDDFRLTTAEEALLTDADHLHTVTVPGVIPELTRLHQTGKLANTLVSADFLMLAHLNDAEFADLLRCVDVAFVGMRCQPEDPRVAEVQRAIADAGMLGIMTFGAQGIFVVDGRADKDSVKFHPVDPVPVRGSTNGCGDAFIAYFLASYWRDGNLDRAIEQGMVGGARATEWELALPDGVYGQ